MSKERERAFEVSSTLATHGVSIQSRVLISLHVFFSLSAVFYSLRLDLFSRPFKMCMEKKKRFDQFLECLNLK
jgi:hypothetical protein